MTSSKSSANSPAKNPSPPPSSNPPPQISDHQRFVNTAAMHEAMADPVNNVPLLAEAVSCVVRFGPANISEFPMLVGERGASMVRLLNAIAVNAAVISFATPNPVTKYTLNKLAEELGYSYDPASREKRVAAWGEGEVIALAVMFLLRNSPIEMAQLIQQVPQIYKTTQPPGLVV